MIKTEAWNGGTQEEYETQHFGFGAQRLKIAMRNMIEQKITNGVKDMEMDLQELLDLNDTDKSTLTRSCSKLIRLYCERAGPSLDIIDGEIEKLLFIPTNVLLPGDECQIEQISNEEYEKLKEEVALLRNRVERGSLMESLLTAEEEELSAVDKVCETARRDMEALDVMLKDSDSNATMKTIQNETQFLCASVSFIDKQDYVLFNEKS